MVDEEKVERAVVNASPLILLGRTGYLHLLQAVARTAVVPEDVEGEVRAKGDSDPAAIALAEASWIARAPVARLSAASVC
jgi:predicted nucleic acid-binding protein